MNFFSKMFSPGFMPHGYCYMWNPRMVWLHAISDGLIALAYFCIPVILIYFIRKNRSLPFDRIFWMFGIFILACGATHWMEIWNIWHATYFVAGLLKAFTAAASILTAAMLIPLLPMAMELPDLLRSQQEELSERLRVEAALRTSLEATEKALEELAENRELMRLMLDGVKDFAIYTVGPQGNVLSWNSGAAKIKGYTSEDIVGRNFSCFYTPEDRANGKPAHELRQALMEGRYENQGQRIRKDGSMFWASLVISPIFDERGTHKGFSKVIRDITQQRQADDQLRRQVALLHLAHDAIIVRDHESRVLFWNKGATRLYGWAESEAVGRVTRELFQSKFPMPMAAIEGALAATGTWEGDLQHTTRDGREVLVASRWAVESFESDKGSYTLEINRDITERIRAADALNQSLAASEGILRELSDQKFALDQHAIVAVTDVQGTISYVNDKICAISEYSREELIGQNHRILNSGHHSKEFFQEMYRSIATGNVWHAEIKNRSKSGSIYWVAATIVPFMEGTRPRQYVAIRADITERKRAEEEISRLHAQVEGRNLELLAQTSELQSVRGLLEQRVAERTAQLTRSNESLEQSNIELQRFAYIASHDLQSPLRSISGFVQLLKAHYESRLDDRGRDWIARTVQSVVQMQELIRDILSYARVDARSQPFVALPLLAAFNDAVSQLESSVHDAGGRVTCDELPTVMGDRPQLAQLIQNLIVNGLKYHSAEPPHVHVSAESGAKEDEWVISVRDNGIGIDPNYHESIFEIFKRLHDQKEYPGTGIGLAVCRRVVERHGGKIWVESEPGRGSNFRFSIPAGAKQTTGKTEEGGRDK